MDNHEHLFVETPEPSLSAGMQHPDGSYTSYYSRRHRRVGHLFQGRFTSQTGITLAAGTTNVPPGADPAVLEARTTTGGKPGGAPVSGGFATR